MEGASWAARWEEMRFLQRHTDHIARMAVISNDEWALIETAALQAPDALPPALRDHSSWHWVKMARTDESLPTRVMYHGKGLFHNYTPEYIGI